MILVDSSVWIDFFNGADTAETQFLSESLGLRPVAMGDLMLAEVLQGFRKDKDFSTALELFETVTTLDLAGRAVAIQSAKNFRKLRAKGFTVRKTIDCVIATYCIEHQLPLLQADRDFEPFHEHLGLQRAFQST
nr:PIN domain nuclease [Oceanococcus sp. HetDA_MAG_MS8]